MAALGFTVAFILWFMVLSPSVRVPAALPWAVPIVVVSVALRALGTQTALLVGSAAFSSALAFVCFSSIATLTEEAHDRAGRSVIWTAAAPDMVVAIMVGAFTLGGVFTNATATTFALNLHPSLAITLGALAALTLAPALVGYRASAHLRARNGTDKARDEITHTVEARVSDAGLSPVEVEVLDLLAHDRSLTAIRNRTGDSLYTLEELLGDICAKLGVQSLAELQSEVLEPLTFSRMGRKIRK